MTLDGRPRAQCILCQVSSKIGYFGNRNVDGSEMWGWGNLSSTVKNIYKDNKKERELFRGENGTEDIQNALALAKHNYLPSGRESIF